MIWCMRESMLELKNMNILRFHLCRIPWSPIPNGYQRKTVLYNWFLTRVSRIHHRERTASFTNGTEKTGYPHAKEWNWIFTSSTKENNLKWTKDVNLRPETTIPGKKTLEKVSYDLGIDNYFLIWHPKHRQQKQKRQVEPHQSKKFLHSQANSRQRRDTFWNVENACKP